MVIICNSYFEPFVNLNAPLNNLEVKLNLVIWKMGRLCTHETGLTMPLRVLSPAPYIQSLLTFHQSCG